MTTSTDYIEFSRPTVQCGTPIVCPLGAQNVQIEIQSPQDQTMLITTSTCITQPNGVIRVEFDDDVTSSPPGVGGTCGTIADGFDVEGARTNDALVGVPADGTWTVTIGFEDPYESQNVAPDAFGNMYEPVRLSIQGKVLCYGVGTNMLPRTTNTVQLFNWRSAAVGESKDAGCAPEGTQDSTTEAFEDPNNGVYFQPGAETEVDDDPQVAQGPFTIDCATQTVVITGFWARGADQVAGSTFVLFRWINGQFESFTWEEFPEGNPTLRSSIGGQYPGHMTTPVVDDGAGATGDHSATIQYNNAIGNAYSFEARDALGRENRNGVTQIPPSQCVVTPPTFGLVSTNTAVVDITASQAQCNGDKTAFSVDVDLGSVGPTLVDMDVSIVRTDTGATLLSVDDSQMFTFGSSVYVFNRTLGPGVYSAIVVADLAGLGFADEFDSAAFNVPTGNCFSPGNQNTLNNVQSIVNNHNNQMHSEHEEILNSANSTSGGGLSVRFTGLSDGESNLLVFLFLLLIFFMIRSLILPAVFATAGIASIFLVDPSQGWNVIVTFMFLLVGLWLHFLPGPFRLSGVNEEKKGGG